MRSRFLILVVLLAARTAAAGDLFDDRPGSSPSIGEIRPFEWTYVPSQPGDSASKPAEVGHAAAVRKPFGAQGTQYGTFGSGIAYNFDKATDLNLRAAWSYFVVPYVEFSTELNAWYFNQPGEDALGINPAFLFRWHFFTQERWSVYSDVGIGLLFTTDDVPDGGTCVNFTPRIGGGFTYELDEDGTRLQVGLRWHHVSNARIEGDANNPARDGLMLYAGVMIPF